MKLTLIIFGILSFNHNVNGNINDGLFKATQNSPCPSNVNDPDKPISCDYLKLEEVNRNLSPALQQLLKTPLFSHFKVNLNKKCQFWDEKDLCSKTDCTVKVLNDHEVPKDWYIEKLSSVDSRLNGFGLNQIDPCLFTDKDFCVLEDEESDDGCYVNLLKNVERYTGYGGDSAKRVWDTIYHENCFHLIQPDNKEKSILSDLVNQDGICEEKLTFYKLISGMHASISTHICLDYFNVTTGNWESNLDCFLNRVGNFPDRMDNLYYDYSLLLKAISKVSKYLINFQYCQHDPEQSELIKKLVKNIAKHAKQSPSPFDESELFKGPDSKLLMDEFKLHFRNISRVMDCVGCQKCKLWGKIQTGGFGTALKILFSYEERSLNPKKNPNLFKRTELVALINTFGRVSESIDSLNMFRQLYLNQKPKQVSTFDTIYQGLKRWLDFYLSKLSFFVDKIWWI